MITRSELTNPNNDVVEFEIGDTEFCFEFDDEE